MKEFIFLFKLLLCSLVLSGGVALADDSIPADQISLTTPVYKPTFHPALGTYTYEVSWQGIPAAEVKVGVEQSGGKYSIWTKVRTYGAIDLFYKLRYQARAKLSSVDFSPLQSVYHQTENSRIKDTELTFMPNGQIHSIRRKKGADPVYYSFNPNNFTLDPFSASFIARGVDWEVGKSNEFDAFNGKSRYLLTLTAEKKITMEVNGVERPVWVIKPHVETLTSKSPSKLREAWIYMTADSFREILEIKSEVFIGTVKTKLDSFEPSRISHPGTQLAAHYLQKEISIN